VFGFSKQAYYKSIVRAEKAAFNEYLIVELIRQKRLIWKKGSGRNLLATLQSDFDCHGICIGRDKFFEVLRRHGLLIPRRGKRAHTTNSYHHFHRYANVIEDRVPDAANQIWVSDITYVWCQKEQCFVYLFLITDMYSRKIVGYATGDNLQASWAVQALQMAIKSIKGPLEGLIHHSDRGVQYCCGDYIEILTEQKIQPSMTQTGDPRDNSFAERLNRTIKQEFMENYKEGYERKSQALEEIPRNIEFYNQIRSHSSIDRLTPNQAHSKRGYLPRKWKNYYSKKNVK